MKLKFKYDSEDEIPEGQAELYTEQDGVWRFSAIEGLKTQEDIAKIQKAKEREVAAHKETKKKVAAWGELDPEETMGKLDRIEELEAAAGDKLDDDKIEAIVTKRTESRIRPLERERDKLKKERDEYEVQIQGFQLQEKKRTVRRAMGKALDDAKVLPSARGDALFLAENVMEVNEEGEILTRANPDLGIEAGLDPTTLITELQDTKTHWWGESVGGGAGGSGRGAGNMGGKNPWSTKNWDMTEQGRIYREKGAAVAERMAAAAGTSIGGPKPKAKA